MKLTYFFFIASFFQIYASSYGQNTKVTLDLDNVTVEKVFSHIEKITDYRFLYNISSVDLNRRVSLSSDKEPLNGVLKRLFKFTNINFKVLEKQIVLKVLEKNNISNETAVQQSISGLVVDENGIPLAGVTILIAGTQNGVVTDFDGKFTLQAKKGDVVVFNYLGYIDQEVPVTEETVYNIQMKPTSFELDQVVISTGYQTITRERATGSFGTVGAKVLETKIDQNILSKIANETPGLLLDNNEGFLVRGINSISGQRTPLIVVDGVALPEGSNVSNINPNDVKSINVLKDAAASSIWGIKSASGVIVIVTKKGSRNSKTMVEASVNTSITSKLDIFDTNIAGPSTQINYQKAYFNANNINVGVDNLFSGPTETIDANQFSQLNPVLETLLMQERGELTQSQANARLNNLSLLDARKEYSNKVLRQTIWNQYNLAISGGGEKQDFRASITFNNNESGLVNVDSKQIIANIRSSIDLSDKLNVSFITNFSQSLENAGPTQLNDGLSIFFDNPATPSGFLSSIPINSRLLDNSGNYVAQFGGANSGFSDFLLSRGVPYDYTYNVLQEYDNADNTIDNANLRLQAALNYEFFEGLDLSLTYRYALNARETKNLFNENTFAARHRVNLFAQIDSNTNRVNNPDTDYVLNKGAILNNSFFRRASHILRGQFNFDKGFKDGLHHITAIAGYEVGITNFGTDSRRLYGYNDVSLKFQQELDFGRLYDNFYNDALPLTRNFKIPEGNFLDDQQDRIYSYYSNLAYTFNDKYTLSGSIRLDDQDFFGAEDDFRNKPLYSVGLKWDAYEELFSSSNIVNSLYLRVSHGTNANTGDKEAGRFLTIVIPQRTSAIFGSQFARISNIPNNLLQLEKVSKTNFGVDFRLLENFISGSVDFYSEVSENLFSSIAFNSTLGISEQEVNAGELTNKGLDVELNFDFSKPQSAFSYNTSLNFSLNKNELTKVEFDNEDISAHIRGAIPRLGKALSTIYSYRYAGLDNTGAPQYFDRNGDIIDLSEDGSEIKESEDLKEEGTLVPIYYGSWINEFAYKNFSLRVLTSLKAGHVFRYNNRFIPGQYGDVVNVTKDFNNRWKEAGDENQTSIPGVPTFSAGGGVKYNYYSSVDSFVDDASHIRLNQINFGYNLPLIVLKKIGFDSLRMSFQVDNVAVWNFNKWDVDPENQFFPLQRAFSFNINTRF
ncbi:hypothetical protein A8C32_19055 [Flavivirga aquatica]|uniref:TonB-dependent receptor plug domain-containing protein n=1 Tax=Flavivirga aquatica TaxID=1849968 RepID=A0A1E5T473_9FLAO|nr:SusC/RagA family TonB-linked outer membrane protein [Flavivirga aquatica]OEK06131.1 hypothetical protein A8C32_19055 [Flavivirga aquatica]